ncbi:MAG: phosphosulfolactate phosphohydrolase [Microbacteriaceae bacterium]|nr:phosphosulfolactate phosphohydrolase [Microbacteriaceae bacterium]
MSDAHSQSTYQVRLGWGTRGLSLLAQADIIVIVDGLDSGIGCSSVLAEQAAALPHQPTVFIGCLRNATTTAQAVYDEQLARGGRTSINLILIGDEGHFAVEDYLVAGAIGDALTARGIDHTAPDLAVAAEGFRSLKNASKHLFLASASGLTFKAEGRGDFVRHSAEHDAEQKPLPHAN